MAGIERQVHPYRLARLIAPCLLVVGGVGVLQYHSMQFWNEHAGAGIGWAWSLLIELAGLWLWYQDDWSSRALGAVASVVLLAAPLYQLGVVEVAKRADVYAAIQAHNVANVAAHHAQQVALQQQDRLSKQARTDAVTALKQSILAHESTIATYLLNSRERVGWADKISQVQDKLDADKAALLRIVAKPVAQVAVLAPVVAISATTATSSFITLFLQAAALVLIQLANIKAMLFLSVATRLQDVASTAEGVAMVQNIQVNVAPPIVEPCVQGDGVIQLQARCLNMMEQQALNAKGLASACGVSRADVSFLLNYEAGGRKPSKAAMAAFREVV
ncbi:MAG: hypothetical protein R8M45_11945 [Ghiorsea sp.]